MTPVLMVGLDATDAPLVRQWIAAGKLPALACLLRRGCYAGLQSPARHYAGAVWSSFYTGQDVPWHGIYHSKLWRPEAMRCEVPRDAWLGARPFWETLSERGHTVCIVDVPMVLGTPRPLRGTYLGGWGTHDLIAKGSWPASLWSELARRYGAPCMPPELFGIQSVATLMQLRDAMLRTSEQMQHVAGELLRRPWDFACVVFGTVHRIAHYLWDLSQIEERGISPAQRALLAGALLEIYQATDAALGRVLEQVGATTLTIAFSVHGIGANPGWSDLVPEILDAAESGAKPEGALYRMKRALPFHLVRPILRSMPKRVTDRMLELWSARMHDWHATRHFALPMDHAAYLRVNLRGREREGIVAPGGEYDAECAALADLFASLRDRDTGLQIAPAPLRAFAEADASATHRALLPDLVVPWDGPTATTSRQLVSDLLPAFRYDVPARLPSGRSGNHTGGAWCIAAGPGIAAGSSVAGHNILDLAPTAFAALGAEALSGFQGAPIAFPAART
jgi:predicted AlkP superfamily phosphohydrolase/phosphomutase